MFTERTFRSALTASALAAAALVATACTPGAGPAGDGPDSAGGAGGRPAARGTALAAVDTLTVKGRAPKTGYEREKFGAAWADVDGNGCGTRDDILKRDLNGVRFTDGHCKVASGTLTDDPYTGTTVRYLRGRSKVDIDHVVALSDAWQKGAGTWDAETRRRFANDPLNLLAVDASTNRRKSDGDAATWLPPNKAYRCTYVARQIAVKKKYRVWVTGGERDAMKRVLATCPQQKLP
ncbi:HNH endonuclease family protein [Streptomyces sp. NPDC094447]|uniref:HNH endonuclease family protein n=1 Tax=unclassified Streptomyces TaxID=2593676 RepID=UPI00368EB974